MTETYSGPRMSARATCFPADMPLELQRLLLDDVAEHAWFSVNIRGDLDGEYERIAPATAEAHEFAEGIVGWFCDKHRAIDLKRGGV